MGRQHHGLEIKQYSSWSPRGIAISAYTRRAHQVALNKKNSEIHAKIVFWGSVHTNPGIKISQPNHLDPYVIQ